MSINEDMELSPGTEKVLPLKSERAHMFSVVSDAVAQPVTVGEKKGLPRNSSCEPLISAGEMSDIEPEKSKLSKRKLKKSGRMTVEMSLVSCRIGSMGVGVLGGDSQNKKLLQPLLDPNKMEEIV
ncbi:uncharacterized protein TNIN_498501 [Trichonephila inaurata madagascariensis]|uniref:Uncharacterized protein n=1 Tax=Trichonephila inaurata madagascariensis TaxID=2747483 RepID=A0A8X6YNB4_9ARAC|nr:uncharacterized protein TNIN_498501 [Trichonephila inaurata madagascariensis]